ncbi:uncharacterized protein HMPREF1541_11022 [Cyphellophora europaea CBS 101466]|uniref:Methyltransferase type 11 domain-containing protein n=1 Tax=Cyphellophora europaea (strain CBS 101466) TaxID=1220924 RepID=W2S5C5_CYPE1|nr:uncharacterized protein HMPREF1541_11022 [Cyphellophora europaea CBS 101466]ETN43891.1 hypothetical protein HMPREF1541_11022 [Cyphellophora europaea CBS 101466]
MTTAPRDSSGVDQALAYEATHVHAVYESIASHFSSTRYKPWPVVDSFLCGLPPGSVGLDVGCGNGKYLNVNKDVFIIGSDRSSNLVDLASKHQTSQPNNAIRNSYQDVLVADSLNLPHADHVFDFAICIAVIHHLSSFERRVAAIRAIVATLKQNGPIPSNSPNDAEHIGSRGKGVSTGDSDSPELPTFAPTLIPEKADHVEAKSNGKLGTRPVGLPSRHGPGNHNGQQHRSQSISDIGAASGGNDNSRAAIPALDEPKFSDDAAAEPRSSSRADIGAAQQQEFEKEQEQVSRTEHATHPPAVPSYDRTAAASRYNSRHVHRRGPGQALLFVWALEQQASRRGWKAGDAQDVLVPWVLKDKDGASRKEPAGSNSNSRKGKSKGKSKVTRTRSNLQKPQAKHDGYGESIPPKPTTGTESESNLTLTSHTDSNSTLAHTQGRGGQQGCDAGSDFDGAASGSAADAAAAEDTDATYTDRVFESPTNNQHNQHQQEKQESQQVFNRYYHLYSQGELERECVAAGAQVVHSGYDRDNWWVVVEPGPVSTA